MTGRCPVAGWVTPPIPPRPHPSPHPGTHPTPPRLSCGVDLSGWDGWVGWINPGTMYLDSWWKERDKGNNTKGARKTLPNPPNPPRLIYGSAPWSHSATAVSDGQ